MVSPEDALFAHGDLSRAVDVAVVILHGKRDALAGLNRAAPDGVSVLCVERDDGERVGVKLAARKDADRVGRPAAAPLDALIDAGAERRRLRW